MNKGGYSSNCKIVLAELWIGWQNIHYHLANLWNWLTTKIFVFFSIITLKLQNFSQSHPVLIRKFWKKLQSDPVLIWPKLASVLMQSDSVLILTHLRWLSVLTMIRLPDRDPTGFCNWEPEPVSSEISDFTPDTHAENNILHCKYVDKADY